MLRLPTSAVASNSAPSPVYVPANACNVSSERADFYGRIMFLASDFTFPLVAVEALIGPDVIKNRTAPKHPAVAQHRDARLTAVHPRPAMLWLLNRARS